MIRYTLRCDQAHEFDSWFKNSAAFDALTENGHLACPSCGSSKVTKALMAPAVRTSRQRPSVPAEAAPAQAVATTEPTAALATDAERMAQLRALMREMRRRMVEQTRDVGSAFAEEARKMHDGLSDETGIRGTASAEDVRSLLEDGIEVLPLPVLPEEHH